MPLVLRGFNSFLDVRPLVFVDKPPGFLICSVCKELSSSTYLIPCGHTLCEPCKKLVISHPSSECCPCDAPTALCPIDGRKFLRREDYYYPRADLYKLLNLRVRCVNASLGCRFVGPLDDIERHCLCDCAYLVTPGGGSARRQCLTPPELGADDGDGAFGVKKDTFVSTLVAKVLRSSAELEQCMSEITRFAARKRPSNAPPI